MKIKVLFFGQLQALFGQHEMVLSDVHATDEVLAVLKRQNPLLEKHTFTMALNEAVIKANSPLKADDVIALLPPFAGG
jgi:molybdopterin converting factor small subunit